MAHMFVPLYLEVRYRDSWILRLYHSTRVETLKDERLSLRSCMFFFFFSAVGSHHWFGRHVSYMQPIIYDLRTANALDSSPEEFA